MELFAVRLPQATEEKLFSLARHMSEEFAGMNAVPELSQLHWNIATDESTILCSSNSNAQPSAALVYGRASVAIARYIIGELEPGLLDNLINQHLHDPEGNERGKVREYCQFVLNGIDPAGLQETQPSLERRIRAVAEEVELSLLSCPSGIAPCLNMSGLLAFRLRTYRDELAEVVEYAMDEYLMDRQHQEFIALLKYFVSLQQPKIALVNLIHTGEHQFLICNGDFNAIDSHSGERLLPELFESEMNVEDMIISTLISLSPEKIQIHTTHPNALIIRTIDTVFEGKVTCCEKCNYCRPFLDRIASSPEMG